MFQNRFRSGTMSLVGQGVFTAGLIFAWIFTGFWINYALAFVSLGAAVVAAAVAIWAEFNTDMKNYRQQIASGTITGQVQPPNAMLSMASMGIALGLIGLGSIAMWNSWHMTNWVIIEIVSVAIGAGLLVAGLVVRSKRQAEFGGANNQQPPQPPVDFNGDNNNNGQW